jgi:hypothetical protein
MRRRFNFLAVGIVLAILSFAYARYDYSDKHSVSVAGTQITFASHDLFGDWMKHEKLFAIVLPVAFLAGGVVLAVRK